ncbi:cardiolipin synthase [Lacticaseibacillus saniviri]
MTTIMWIVVAILVLNTLGAIITVLREVRDISTTWAWLLVLIFLPVIGFGIYMFAGRGLSAKKVQQIQEQYVAGVDAFLALQKHENNRNRLLPPSDLSPASRELVNLFLNTDQAPVLGNNQLQIYTDGEKKFAALFRDIDAAKSFIYIEYYTIYADQLGHELQRHLVAKAKEGVTIKVLYDAWGSLGATAKFWRPLTDVGGQVETYFSSQHIFTDFRLNYRDHRKVVVIDDAVGYIGGFNVGDQYVSRDPKFGYWRDTHLRVQGDTVQALKVRFLMDWNATVKDDKQIAYSVKPLENTEPSQLNTPIQIVASGPDNHHQQIKFGYTKMISSATESVWIQTPYLVPDDTVFDALTSAALSGIDVRIMVPDMPDHPFIFRATQYYANALTALGVKVYHYQNGFLHAKTMIVDGKIASVGSANLDIRSFKLNFEINAFIYDRQVAGQLRDIFEDDLKKSRLLTVEEINHQSRWLHFKQRFSRLLSPIL